MKTMQTNPLITVSLFQLELFKSRCLNSGILRQVVLKQAVLNAYLSLFILVIAVLISGNAAQAHQSSTAYLSIQQGTQSSLTTAEYRLAIRDLALLTPLDADNNATITWGELKAQQANINQLLQQKLRWTARQKECAMNSEQQPVALDHIAGMTYLVAYLSIDCGQATLEQLDYKMLAHIDSGHRLIISIADSTSHTRTWLIAPGITPIQSSPADLGNTFKTYVEEGIHHILSGYDHLLFLLCLLLPAVYQRQQHQWVPVASAKTAIKHTLYIATAFTLAHSITLSLAALNILSIPSRLIESVIAFSIALAALNNLIPILGNRQVLIAFLFGLVHGFGFASALSDLPIDTAARVMALFSFNVGIELGQLSCILIFLPIALLIRHQSFYRHVIFQAGSVLACLLALIWMTQRMFDLHLIAG